MLAQAYASPHHHPVPASTGAPGGHAVTAPMDLRLSVSTRALTRILDVVDYGLLLVAEEGQLLYANTAAHADLRKGHALRLEGNVLSLQDAGQAQTLRHALQAATRRSKQSLLMLRQGRVTMPVSVVPLVEAGELAGALLVLGKRQACEELSLDAFCRQYELTSAERRVLRQLSLGEKATLIAKEGGVKLSTVRSQISSIRAKTGVRDIVQLMQLVLRLPPLPCLTRGMN